MDNKNDKGRTNFIDVELDDGEHLNVMCDILSLNERKELVEKIWQKGFWKRSTSLPQYDIFYPPHRIKVIRV